MDQLDTRYTIIWLTLAHTPTESTRGKSNAVPKCIWFHVKHCARRLQQIRQFPCLSKRCNANDLDETIRAYVQPTGLHHRAAILLIVRHGVYAARVGAASGATFHVKHDQEQHAGGKGVKTSDSTIDYLRPTVRLLLQDRRVAVGAIVH